MKTSQQIDISNATPRPWVYARTSTSAGSCFKIGSPEQVNSSHGPICIYDDHTSLNPRKIGNAEADAKLVVQAVNEHAALCAVAEAAEIFYETSGDVPMGCKAYADASAKLFAAIESLSAIRKDGK